MGPRPRLAPEHCRRGFGAGMKMTGLTAPPLNSPFPCRPCGPFVAGAWTGVATTGTDRVADRGVDGARKPLRVLGTTAANTHLNRQRDTPMWGRCVSRRRKPSDSLLVGGFLLATMSC